MLRRPPEAARDHRDATDARIDAKRRELSLPAPLRHSNRNVTHGMAVLLRRGSRASQR
jgi:hypothetical protein